MGFKSNYEIVGTVEYEEKDITVYFNKKTERFMLINNDKVVELDENIMANIYNKIKFNKSAKANVKLYTALLIALLAVNATSSKKIETIEADYNIIEAQPDYSYGVLAPYIEVIDKYNINEALILKKLNKIDLKKIDNNEESIMNALNAILPSEFIANQLYCYVNNIKQDNKTNLCSLVLYNNDLAVKTLLSGYSIEDVLSGLNIDYNLDDDEFKSSVRTYFLQKYQEINTMNDYGYALYNSDLFGGPNKAYANIFSDVVVVDIKNKYPSYYRNGNNISDEYYKEEFYNMIYNSVTNVDYTDQDYRLLIYLYVGTSLFNSSIEDPIDIYNSLGNGVFSKEDFYNYVATKEINYDQFFNALTFMLYSENSDVVGIFEEVLLCLNEDMIAGKLSEDKYNDLIKTANNVIKENHNDVYIDWLNAFDKKELLNGYKINIVKSLVI